MCKCPVVQFCVIDLKATQHFINRPTRCMFLIIGRKAQEVAQSTGDEGSIVSPDPSPGTGMTGEVIDHALSRRTQTCVGCDRDAVAPASSANNNTFLGHHRVK